MSRIGPENVITKEELDMMLFKSDNIRDKALIATFFESDFRHSEFLSLRKRNVTLDKLGAKIQIEEQDKTEPRWCRLIMSTTRLAT